MQNIMQSKTISSSHSTCVAAKCCFRLFSEVYCVCVFVRVFVLQLCAVVMQNRSTIILNIGHLHTISVCFGFGCTFKMYGLLTNNQMNARLAHKMHHKHYSNIFMNNLIITTTQSRFPSIHQDQPFRFCVAYSIQMQ